MDGKKKAHVESRSLSNKEKLRALQILTGIRNPDGTRKEPKQTTSRRTTKESSPEDLNSRAKEGSDD